MANSGSFNPLFIGVDAGRILGSKATQFPGNFRAANNSITLTPSAESKRIRTVAGLADWQKNKSLRYIDDHIEECIRVEELAAQVKLSASRFSKAFKVSFGRSPYDYVLSRRIEAAKFLIVSTEEPLSQVAHACGLSDQAHLSKVFKRLVGVTPLRYRRSGLRTRVNSTAPAGWARLAPTLDGAGLYA